MESQSIPLCVLTIGGTDPCGAYGVMADLKTFGAMGVYGQAVITMVTAQNSRGWWGGTPISAEMIGHQLRAVLEDYGSAGVKTGFLDRAGVIQTVAEWLEAFEISPVVVDPVLVDGGGRAMFGGAVVQAVRERLLPLAAVVTPNQAEARLLLGRSPEAKVYWPDEIAVLSELAGQAAWVIKGDQLEGRWGDWLIAGQAAEFLPQPRIETPNTAGTGDTFSAALIVELARGMSPAEAVRAAQAFTHRAIARAAGWRLASGRGPTANFLPAQ